MEEQIMPDWMPQLMSLVNAALSAKKNVGISVMGISNDKNDAGLYVNVSPRRVVWRYDRADFKALLGVYLLVLPGGKVFSVMPYKDALTLKRRLDAEVATTARDAREIIKMQQEMLAGYQKRMEQLQKRLEALEARSIERDLGAEG